MNDLGAGQYIINLWQLRGNCWAFKQNQLKALQSGHAAIYILLHYLQLAHVFVTAVTSCCHELWLFLHATFPICRLLLKWKTKTPAECFHFIALVHSPFMFILLSLHFYYMPILSPCFYGLWSYSQLPVYSVHRAISPSLVKYNVQFFH